MPKAKLRQDNVRSLPYVGNARGKAQSIYWDLALPGFGLRKFPNGRGSYVCKFYSATRLTRASRPWFEGDHISNKSRSQFRRLTPSRPTYVWARATSVSGREPLPQPRRADQYVRGHMKAIPNLTHHGHAELTLPRHDLANPTGRSQEFGKLGPCEAVLVHEIGQKLRERGRPTGPTAPLVRFDQSRLGDEASLIRWIG